MRDFGVVCWCCQAVSGSRQRCRASVRRNIPHTRRSRRVCERWWDSVGGDAVFPDWGPRADERSEGGSSERCRALVGVGPTFVGRGPLSGWGPQERRGAPQSAGGRGVYRPSGVRPSWGILERMAGVPVSKGRCTGGDRRLSGWCSVPSARRGGAGATPGGGRRGTPRFAESLIFGGVL